ncbi:unnamed protein product, partial [Linum tenue]
ISASTRLRSPSPKLWSPIPSSATPISCPTTNPSRPCAPTRCCSPISSTSCSRLRSSAPGSPLRIWPLWPSRLARPSSDPRPAAGRSPASLLCSSSSTATMMNSPAPAVVTLRLVITIRRRGPSRFRGLDLLGSSRGMLPGGRSWPSVLSGSDWPPFTKAPSFDFGFFFFSVLFFFWLSSIHSYSLYLVSSFCYSLEKSMTLVFFDLVKDL